MGISGVHLLLTYRCLSECDHCFLYCGPHAVGAMTIADMREILREAKKLGSVESIYFEGGEPFLYYPVVLAGIEEAKAMGFKVGIVTDPYWATTVEDAMEWLRPISKLGISDLSISDDAFHRGEDEENLGMNAVEAAKRLGISVGTITIEEPQIQASDRVGLKGEIVVGGGVMFRGRAVEKLVAELPRRPWHEFTECRHEDLANPGRVHVDPFGFVHLCQGLTAGNCKDAPFAGLMRSYDPYSHPICGPLLEGGPAALVRKYSVPHEDGYVDECHLCYCARLALRSKFPGYLAPGQAYGEQ